MLCISCTCEATHRRFGHPVCPFHHDYFRGAVCPRCPRPAPIRNGDLPHPLDDALTLDEEFGGDPWEPDTDVWDVWPHAPDFDSCRG